MSNNRNAQGLCYIKGCQKKRGMKEVSFYGKKVKMCGDCADRNKHLK